MACASGGRFRSGFTSSILPDLSARLIVEADGGVHALRTYDDAKRDAWLTSQGFQVLHFSNGDILGKPYDVLAAMRSAVDKPPSVRLRLPPSPEMGEGLLS